MNKAKGSTYILFALGAAGALAAEALLAYLIEPWLYHMQMPDWNTGHYIIHWLVICAVWLITGILLVSGIKRKTGFEIWEKGAKLKPMQWILIGLSIALSLVISYIDWNGFKVIKEFQQNGPLKFVFQYLYYIMETLMFNLILIFGQKACELWFHAKNIPYGGIIVAVTWGIGHFATKGIITGILSTICGLVFGAAYLLTNRDARKTFIVTFLLFVL